MTENESEANEAYVVQTRTYRQWLDASYTSSALLFALTVQRERDLSCHCHGAFTWTDLERSLRDPSAHCSSLQSISVIS